MPENLNSVLQQEIAQMEQALAEKRQVLEGQQVSGEITDLPHPKETIREIVKEQFQAAPPPVSGTTDGSADNQAPIPLPPPPVEPPLYLSAELKEQVQALVNLAFTQSISQAIKQVRVTNNAALIDAFHDVLADELYNLLVERGKLPKI